MKKYLLLLFFIVPISIFAQVTLTGKVSSSKDDRITNATITIHTQPIQHATSDKNGNYTLLLTNPGNYKITVSHLNFQNYSSITTIKDGQNVLNFILKNEEKNIEEVFVTAQESKNLQTSSVITKEAMDLLQPSSFADLLELLPGGRAQDPNLTSLNSIKLREVNLKGKTMTSEKYDMSSLGISFYMDGAPINTNADLQSVNGYSTSTNNTVRDNTNKGLDLRSLGTDDIEKVTIVRGIPSVEYGDLASGLVLIERKKGYTPYTLRAKTDGFGKLFALGKGYNFKDSLLLNIDLGYIRAAADPTNSFENFNRATGSLRLDKTWKGETTYNWRSNLDYNTTLDNKKTDPDNSYTVTDTYYGRKQRYALNNQLFVYFKGKNWIDQLNFVSNLSFQKDIIEEDKWIQARTATILVNSLEQGSHEAQFLTPSYLSHLFVEGIPFTAFHKLTSTHDLNFNTFKNKLKLGVESNYAKNKGQGQVYDLDYPTLTNTTSTARPRAFKDIPATHTLSAFAEDNISLNFLDFKFNAMFGVRAFTMTSLDDQYTMANKIYAEPRANVRLELPNIQIANKPFSITLGAGAGVHKKNPTLDHLYPNLQYRDIVELNFFHNNKDYRIAQAYTDITNPINYDIKPATNNKLEFNTDFAYNGNRLSLTFFKEKMHDAFRPNNLNKVIHYNKYDNLSIDASNITVKPNVTDFASTSVEEFYNYSVSENGSIIDKKGAEFQLSTRRFTTINTRFTVVGAWYWTEYKNSLAIWKNNTDIIHNGLTRQVSGLYADDDGYIREMLNTNFTADSYLPALGLNFSASFQALWYTASENMRKNGTPISYKFVNDQIVRPFTEESLLDPTLQQLVEVYNESNFMRTKVPLDLQINIKASKNFRNLIKASVFANRLFLYRPKYTSTGGATIVRTLDAPYFGMEISITL